MHRRLAFLLTAALTVWGLPATRAATNPAPAFDYFCPAVYEQVITRELPATRQAQVLANATVKERTGNRELLDAVVADHGGKRGDWRLVAHGDGETFRSIGDLALAARHKDGRIVPVPTISLAELSITAAGASTYTVKRKRDGDLLSSTLDTKSVVICTEENALGAHQMTGQLESVITFGPVGVGKQKVRAHRPTRAKLTLAGSVTSPEGVAIAEITLTLRPALVRVRPQAESTAGDS